MTAARKREARDAAAWPGLWVMVGLLLVLAAARTAWGAETPSLERLDAAIAAAGQEAGRIGGIIASGSCGERDSLTLDALHGKLDDVAAELRLLDNAAKRLADSGNGARKQVAALNREIGRLRWKLVEMDRRLARMARAGPLAEAWAAYKKDKTVENFTRLFQLAKGRQPNQSELADYDLTAQILYKEILLPKAVTGVALGLAELNQVCKILVEVLSGEAFKKPGQTLALMLIDYLDTTLLPDLQQEGARLLENTGLDEVFDAVGLTRMLQAEPLWVRPGKLEEAARAMAQESYDKAVAALHGIDGDADLTAEIESLVAAREQVGLLLDDREAALAPLAGFLEGLDAAVARVRAAIDERRAQAAALNRRAGGLAAGMSRWRRSCDIEAARAAGEVADVGEEGWVREVPFVWRSKFRGPYTGHVTLAADQYAAALLGLERGVGLYWNASGQYPNADPDTSHGLSGALSFVYRLYQNIDHLLCQEYVSGADGGRVLLDPPRYCGCTVCGDLCSEAAYAWQEARPAGGEALKDPPWGITITEVPGFLALDSTTGEVTATRPGAGALGVWLRAAEPVATTQEARAGTCETITVNGKVRLEQQGDLEAARYDITAYGLAGAGYTLTPVEGGPVTLAPGDHGPVVFLGRYPWVTATAGLRFAAGDTAPEKTASLGPVIHDPEAEDPLLPTVTAKRLDGPITEIHLPVAEDENGDPRAGAMLREVVLGLPRPEEWEVDDGPWDIPADSFRADELVMPAPARLLYVRPPETLERQADPFGRVTFRWVVPTDDPRIDLSFLVARWEVFLREGVVCENDGEQTRFTRTARGWEAEFTPRLRFAPGAVASLDDVRLVLSRFWGSVSASAILPDGGTLASTRSAALSDIATVGLLNDLFPFPGELDVFYGEVLRNPDPAFSVLARVNGRLVAGSTSDLGSLLARQHDLPQPCSVTSEERWTRVSCPEVGAGDIPPGTYGLQVRIDLADAVRGHLLFGLAERDNALAAATIKLLLNRIESHTDWTAKTTTVRVFGPTDMGKYRMRWYLGSGGTETTGFSRDPATGEWTTTLAWGGKGDGTVPDGKEVVTAADGAVVGAAARDSNRDGVADDLQPLVAGDPATGGVTLAAGGTALALTSFATTNTPPPPAGVFLPLGPARLRATGVAAGGAATFNWNLPAGTDLPGDCSLWLYGPPAAGEQAQWHDTGTAVNDPALPVTFQITDDGPGDLETRDAGVVAIVAAVACPARRMTVGPVTAVTADGRTRTLDVHVDDSDGRPLAGVTVTAALAGDGPGAVLGVDDLGSGDYLLRYRPPRTTAGLGPVMRIVVDAGAGAREMVSVPLLPLGDVDSDGEVSIADLGRLLGLAAGRGLLPPDLERIDCNGDQRLDLADAVTLARYLAGLSAVLPR